MKIKLSVFTLDELEKLEVDLKTEIQARRERIAKAEEAEDYASVITRASSQKRSGKFYQHPLRPHLTWSGRGRKPAWVVDLQKSGYTIEELAAA